MIASGGVSGGGARRRPVKVGLVLPLVERQQGGKTARWSDLRAMARLAEDVGFDSVWLPDHLLFRFEMRLGLRVRLGAWECWSVLCALAASTRRVELGTIVCCTAFRNPALLARMADTVNDISGGRLILGLGAGWHEPEFDAFGFPFDHRVSRFEEAVTIIATLLRRGRVDFHGRYYQALDCELRPGGQGRASPPLMIGTTGERMLSLTARFADLWNAWLIFGRSHPGEIPPLRARVDAACRRVGRDPASLGRSVAIRVALGGRSGRVLAALWRIGAGLAGASTRPSPLIGSPAGLADALLGFAGQGISHVQVEVQSNSLAEVEAFARVLDALDRGG
jgi:alkanesulfonate monooxygenase SsuD/methylene tetrahydromethanopterin reductase-like flavin-dependent oxidoreductase (luciferase family)